MRSGAPVGGERSGTGDDGDLAALEQRLEPARQPVDHLLLAHLRDRHVERGRGGLHAELGRAADRPVHLGRLQELLGRDAAAVQAGATDPALLDHGDVETRRGAVQRGRVAARSATQHDEIEFRFGHGRAPFLREIPSRSPIREGLVSCRVQLARIVTWTANATRIANPVMAARISSVRVLTPATVLARGTTPALRPFPSAAPTGRKIAGFPGTEDGEWHIERSGW